MNRRRLHARSLTGARRPRRGADRRSRLRLVPRGGRLAADHRSSSRRLRRLPGGARRAAPGKSVVLTAPSSGADLLIVDLAANGATVKAGDVVVQFDSTTQQRTLEQRRSELKQAESELQKAEAEGRAARAGRGSGARRKCGPRGTRAKLDLQGAELRVARRGREAAQLALVGRRTASHPARAEDRGRAPAAAADVAIARQKRDKAQYDVAETERIIASLTVKAPAAGHDLVDAQLPRRRTDEPHARRNSGAATARGSARRSRTCRTSPPIQMTAAAWTKPIARACSLAFGVRVRVDAIPDRELTAASRTSRSWRGPTSRRSRRCATSTSSSR